MSYSFDALIARHRHEEMLREAAAARRARLAAKANGSKSLLSRMVNLLSRSNRPKQHQGRSEEKLDQHQLA